MAERAQVSWRRIVAELDQHANRRPELDAGAHTLREVTFEVDAATRSADPTEAELAELVADGPLGPLRGGREVSEPGVVGRADIGFIGHG